jgi:Transposase DDE domain
MEVEDTNTPCSMNQINLISATLRPHLRWHGARIAFLALFLVALLRVKTVSFSHLAQGFMGKAQTQSSEKRLQRFFRDFELDYEEIAKLVAGMMDIPQPWVLSIDRTNWQFGDTVFNILMLGVVHEGIAFPLVWTMLPKKGNSNYKERIQLLERFREIFPDVQVGCLTGDREFIGNKWFDYLLNQTWTPFRLRIKHNCWLFDGSNSWKASIVFAHLQIGEQQVLKRRRRIGAHWVYVSGLRLEDNELLILITNCQPRSAISDYAKRWGIETLFGCLKTRGFCLEATHLKEPERLSRMLALLTIALCWAFKTGEWLAEQKPIKIKNHGRKAKSIFRLGLDYLSRIFLNLNYFETKSLEAIHFLSST